MVLTKTCSKCKSVYPIDFFCLKSDHSTGFDPQCRDCKSAVRALWLKDNPRDQYMKEYAYSNKAKLSTYKKSHYQRNLIRYKSNRKIYAKENKEKLRLCAAKYQRERRKRDIEYRILQACRGRIWYALKSGKKASKTIKLIGCEISFLKSWLEEKFKPGMSWDNYGEWHIDHIIPCARFNLGIVEQQYACFHYTNLQPLWRLENIKKGAKILYG